MNSSPRRSGLRAFVALLVLVPVVLFARTDRSYLLSRGEKTEVMNFVRLLQDAHYNRGAVTPKDYPQVLKKFMEDWDPQHLFFLQSDADLFSAKFADGLYWNVSTLGDVSAAFEIFQKYEERFQDRANWVFERLKGDFNTGSAEQFTIDRDKQAWVADATASDALWEKRLLFEIEQELINDHDLEQAKERVRKRYERRLKNVADVETSEITEAFLSDIAQLYDPHSTYFSADTYENFSIQMRLQLVGIGALLGTEEDECVIREIIPGGPADLDKRLKPNDKIIAVAQPGQEPVDLFGMKLQKIVDMIRGDRGTQVLLTVQPADAPDTSVREEVALTRNVVNLDSARARGAVFQVPSEDGKSTMPIGVISLPSFYGPDPSAGDTAQNSATEDVAKLIGMLQKENIQGLVLDLRDNGGGLLNEAINLTGLFIENGPVVQVRSFYGDVKVDEDDDKSVSYAGPLAVLVSKFSASASEIVAGALQNYGRAVVLGDSSTHGKGTVQTVYEMSNLNRELRRTGAKSGAAKFTIQKFYLPSGSSTQLNGVVPDIVLPSVEDAMETGERFLPHALVWDEIETTHFNGAPLDQHILGPLRAASTARQGSLPEFQYLRDNVDWFTKRQEQKTVSLNLDDRIAQRDADKAFKDKMDDIAKHLRDGNFTYKEFTLTPPKPTATEVAPAADTPASEKVEPTQTAAPEAEKKAASPQLAQAEGATAPADENATPAEEEKSAEPEPEGYARLDIHLREALRVLVDAVAIGHEPSYAEHAPLTARTASGG